MIAIAAENAPEKTDSIISTYRARWFIVSLPTLLFAGAALVMLTLPMNPEPSGLTRKLWAGGFLLALVLWWHFTFIVPTRKYNNLVASGFIIEIRNQVLLDFNKKYWGLAEKSINRARRDENTRYARLLRDMSVMADAREDYELQDLIAAEMARVAKLRLTD